MYLDRMYYTPSPKIPEESNLMKYLDILIVSGFIVSNDEGLKYRKISITGSVEYGTEKL